MKIVMLHGINHNEPGNLFWELKKDVGTGASIDEHKFPNTFSCCALEFLDNMDTYPFILE